MRRKVSFLLMAVMTSVSQGQNWNTLGNLGTNPGTNYLGTQDNNALMLRTNAMQRLRLNANQSYAIGPFAAQAKNGALGLCPDGTMWTTGPGPFSLLHLADATVDNMQVYGYRPWMRNGVTFTGNGDQAYVGQKYTSLDNTDVVIQWSDNPADSPWGVDRMRFIFTNGYNGSTTGARSMEGLEGMRLYPKNDYEMNVGIGDFHTYGGDPTERLHVRDGRVRIQQLPTDPVANNLTKVMVVDNAGVVKWRDANTLGAACGSGWSLQGNNAVTAYNGNPCIPQSPDRVGIGTNGPTSKVHVVSDVLGSGGSYTAMRVDNLTPTVDGNGVDYEGLRVQTIDLLLPPISNSVFFYGGRFIATNATKANIGVDGEGSVTTGFSTPMNIGIRGTAHPSATGGAYGVQGVSSGAGFAGYFLANGGGNGLRVDGNSLLLSR